MKRAVALVLFILAAAAIGTAARSADALPIAQVTDSPAFDSAQDAAIAALALIGRPVGRFERGGAIVCHNGKYFYTTPVAGDEDALGFVIRKLKSDELVAIYHTHPVVDRSKLWIIDAFSKGDMRAALQLHTVSYLYVEGTHHILVFDPAAKTATRYAQSETYGGREIPSNI